VPVASASLGQVYRARLLTGEEVAVKVQRDDVLETLAIDAVAVRSFVAMVSQLFSTETDFAAIADEIVGRISDELDYAREARDCEAFARLYKNQDVCVPRVFQEFCGPRVLTLSYLPGTKLDEWGRSGPSPAQKKRIIEEGVKCTARQFFEVGFCAEIKFRAPHAIDAPLSLLDGVEVLRHRRDGSMTWRFTKGRAILLRIT